MAENWRDANHPLKAGMLLGLLMRHDIDAFPVMDGTDYTPEIDVRVTFNDVSRLVRIRVLP